jgi:hypothetical protein
MPRNSREPTLARQWKLLKLIPRHRPGMSARELCERLKHAGHEVTKRTAERDLPELSIVFPLECNDVSMPYGWYRKAAASFDIPGIALAVIARWRERHPNHPLLDETERLLREEQARSLSQ